MNPIPHRSTQLLQEIQTFYPCADWFFVHTTAQGKKVLHRLAGWAHLKNGHIIGLESLRLPADYYQESSLPCPPSLVPVPSYEGCYLHFSDLTAAEKETLAGYQLGGS